jgi:outer membrane receptor protein involved in Fe transport
VSDVAGVVPGNAPGAAACRASVAAYTADAGGAGDPDVDRCQPLDLFGPGRASQAAIDYGLRGSAGILGLRAYGTYLQRFDELPSPDPNQINHNAGETTAPKWRINTRATYRLGGLTTNWTVRYLGSAELDAQDDPIETTDPQGFGAQLYHDIQVRYETSHHFTLFAGVNNLFDKQPPRGSRVFSDRAAALYEQIGSYYYAGVSAYY